MDICTFLIKVIGFLTYVRYVLKYLKLEVSVCCLANVLLISPTLSPTKTPWYFKLEIEPSAIPVKINYLGLLPTT